MCVRINVPRTPEWSMRKSEENQYSGTTFTACCKRSTCATIMIMYGCAQRSGSDIWSEHETRHMYVFSCIDFNRKCNAKCYTGTLKFLQVRRIELHWAPHGLFTESAWIDYGHSEIYFAYWRPQGEEYCKELLRLLKKWRKMQTTVDKEIAAFS